MQARSSSTPAWMSTLNLFQRTGSLCPPGHERRCAMVKWISFEEAEARITIRTSLPDPEPLIRRGINRGEIRTNSGLLPEEAPEQQEALPEKAPEQQEAIVDGINLQAAGITWVDRKYDEGHVGHVATH